MAERIARGPWLLALVLVLVGGCSLLAPDAAGIVGERDAGATDDGSLGGMGASTGLGGSSGNRQDCGSPFSADYEVRRVPTGVVLTVDGMCSEDAWTTAPVMNFVGPSNSENEAECRFLWDPSDAPRMFGCCTIQDTDVRALETVNDSKFFSDDSLEYFLRSAPDAALTVGTVKIFISARGTTRDESFPGNDTTYDADIIAKVGLDGSLNDLSPDVSYTLEWSSVLSPTALTTTEYRCAFAFNDGDLGPDGGLVKTSGISFAGGSGAPTINHLENWGTCHFSCRVSGE